MSELSLLTGVYANVEVYASLIDRVIENMRRPGSTDAQQQRLKLGNLLIDASDQGRASGSIEALIFDSLLRSDSGVQHVDLKGLGQRLLSGADDTASQRQLESLAKELEKERAEVASRLRGR